MVLSTVAQEAVEATMLWGMVWKDMRLLASVLAFKVETRFFFSRLAFLSLNSPW